MSLKLNFNYLKNYIIISLFILSICLNQLRFTATTRLQFYRGKITLIFKSYKMKFFVLSEFNKCVAYPNIC
jgi:hypothetical protein